VHGVELAMVDGRWVPAGRVDTRVRTEEFQTTILAQAAANDISAFASWSSCWSEKLACGHNMSAHLPTTVRGSVEYPDEVHTLAGWIQANSFVPYQRDGGITTFWSS